MVIDKFVLTRVNNPYARYREAINYIASALIYSQFNHAHIQKWTCISLASLNTLHLNLFGFVKDSSALTWVLSLNCCLCSNFIQFMFPWISVLRCSFTIMDQERPTKCVKIRTKYVIITFENIAKTFVFEVEAQISNDIQRNIMDVIHAFVKRDPIVLCHGPLARYVNLRVAHAPGVPGTFLPATTGKRPRHASRHARHARAVMHVGIANLRIPLNSVAGENVPGIPEPATLRIW